MKKTKCKNNADGRRSCQRQIRQIRPKNNQQLSFIKPQVKFFGGILLKGRRKSIRPLSSKDTIHFVFRSSWAMGSDSFLASRNRKSVDLLISRFAKKFGVKIYQRAINTNHIHLLLKITNRTLYKAFIRALSGKIASQVMGQQSFKLFKESRLSSLKSKRASEGGDGSNASNGQIKSEAWLMSEGFWDYRPFSRVVSWGRDFNNCIRYLKQNILEALGFVPYTARKDYYSRWFSARISESLPDI